MTLEELLKRASERGLTHVSVWPVWTEGNKQQFWAAQVTTHHGGGALRVEKTNPADALAAVLEHVPSTRQQRPAPAPAVTAPVTDEPDEPWMIK